MRLAIADPPYPPSSSRPRASRWYSDRHPDAAAYDDPAAHRALVAQLAAFDGWALACPADAVGLYGPPPNTRVCVWVVPNAASGAGRVLSRWEAVIVSTPAGRRHYSTGPRIPDYLVAPAPRQGFPGEKPRQWTRWCLDLLGYDPDTDTVADLFPGSGAVTAQIAQGVLNVKPKRWRCPVCGARWQLVDAHRPAAGLVGVRQLYGVCVVEACRVTTITVTVTE